MIYKIKLFVIIFISVFSNISFALEMQIECSDTNYRYELKVEIQPDELAKYSHDVMKTSYIGTFKQTAIESTDNVLQKIKIRADELEQVNKCIWNKFKDSLNQKSFSLNVEMPKILQNEAPVSTVNNSVILDKDTEELLKIEQYFATNNLSAGYHALGKMSGYIKDSQNENLKKMYKKIVETYFNEGVLKISGKVLAKLNTSYGSSEGKFISSYLNNSYLKNGRINADLLLLDEYEPMRVFSYNNSINNCPKNSILWKSIVEKYKTISENEKDEFIKIMSKKIIENKNPLNVDLDKILVLFKTCIGESL